MADREVNPGEPHWKKSDRPLKHHTRAEETKATYTLFIWPDPPYDEDATDQGQIFKCIIKEWSVQVEHMREEAASEATKANKDDGGEDDEDDNKQTKLKSKRSSHKTAGKQKSLSLKKVELHFKSSQDKNSQQTADVTFTDFPKESKVTESKDEPKSSSHGNIHRSPHGSGGGGSPKPSSKSKGSPQ